MGYHKPTTINNIRLGNVNDYTRSLVLVENFERFIEDTCLELAEYDEKTLAEHGISCNIDSITKKRDPWYYALRIDGALYQMDSYKSNYFVTYSATQHGETPSMAKLRLLTGICGSIRTMNFDSRKEHVTPDFDAREYSFGGREALDKDEVEKYIEGFVPDPRQKIVFREEYGKYSKVYKEREERPIEEYDVKNHMFFTKYLNADKTPYVSPTTVVSTYPSFEASREEMVLKIEEFKNAWRKVLEDLRKKDNNKVNQK